MTGGGGLFPPETPAFCGLFHAQENTMTLKEMQEKREKLVVDARAALEEITKNTDDARASELEARHDTIMGEFDKNEAAITREERQAKADKLAEEQRARLRPIGADTEVAGSDQGGDELSYRDAFYRYVRAEGQIGALDAETRSVLQRGYQAIEPSQEQRALTTTTNAGGGFTVPTELQAILIRTMKAWGPMYDPGVTEEITTSHGHSFPFPTIDDTSNSGAATTQGTALTDDGSGDPVFGQKSLGAWSFGTPWVRVSKELADDSVLAMESLLGSLLGERLGRLANSQLTVGVGTTAPNGAVTASTLGKTTAAVAAVTFDEIMEFEHSIDPAYRASPKFAFMMNDTSLLAIRKLKDGQGNYLWQAGNVQAGIPNTINARQYYINQAMASMATSNKFMIAGDFSKYFVRKVGAPLIGAIQDKDFWPGFGVAGWIRFDGNLLDTAAVKHMKNA
jgi:HK97 family phage major capsid protein